MRMIFAHSLSIAAVAPLTLLPGNFAAQDNSGILNSLDVRQFVGRAEPDDHLRLSAHFSALGNRYAARAKRHRSMAQSFIGNHDRLAGLSRDAAKEATAADEMHKGLAGVARCATRAQSGPAFFAGPAETCWTW